MHKGVLLALLAYAIFAIGDAIIKAIGDGLGTFQIVFWTTLFSVIPIYITKPKEDKLSEIFQANRPLLLHIRGCFIFLSIVCVVYAFTHIPLAEAYALIFLAPVFATILAVIFLKEHMTPQRWLSLVLGFCGVLLVMRPGFTQIQTGHLAALSVACTGSIGVILLKLSTKSEKRTTIVGFATTYIILLSLAAMLIFEGGQIPAPLELATLAAIGVIGGSGQVALVTASQQTPAARIAQAQYSQMFWAIFFGVFFFSETPDLPTIAGICVIMLAGLINVGMGQPRTMFSTNWTTRWRKK